MSQLSPSHRPLRQLLLPAALCAAIVSTPVHAWRLNWFVELAVEHNDNVLLTESDPISASILRPAVGFSLSQEGATVQAQVNGLVEHRNYLDDEYGSELLSELNGTLNWVMMPGRLHFTVQDRLSVQPIVLAAPDAPNNRQQTNVFAAGPTLYFRLSPTINGQAEARWVDTRARETAAFDSQRLSAAVRAIKDLGATRSISANLQAQQVDLDDNTIVSDYDRYDAFARYRQTLNRLELGLEAGYSWLEYDDGQSRSSPLFRALLGWRASERSSLDLVAARRYSDTAESMIEPTPIDGGVPTIPPMVIIGDEVVNATAYRETSLEAGYGYDGTRADFAIRPFYRKLEYPLETGPDQTGRGVFATWSWLLQHDLALTLEGRTERLRFDNTGVENDTWLASAWLRKQWTPHWSGRVGYTRYERDSSESGLSAEQNVYLLAVRYTR